jgi:hypothetical protein
MRPRVGADALFSAPNITAHIVLQFRQYKIVYRQYAGLFFCLCVDVNDNNLAYMEAIHNFVEILNSNFTNVCELDLLFNFYVVCVDLNSQQRSYFSHIWGCLEALCCCKIRSLRPGTPPRTTCHRPRQPDGERTLTVSGESGCVIWVVTHRYALVDEMFLAGEIQETSPSKVLNRLRLLTNID